MTRVLLSSGTFALFSGAPLWPPASPQEAWPELRGSSASFSGWLLSFCSLSLLCSRRPHLASEVGRPGLTAGQNLEDPGPVATQPSGAWVPRSADPAALAARSWCLLLGRLRPWCSPHSPPMAQGRLICSGNFFTPPSQLSSWWARMVRLTLVSLRGEGGSVRQRGPRTCRFLTSGPGHVACMSCGWPRLLASHFLPGSPWAMAPAPPTGLGEHQASTPTSPGCVDLVHAIVSC